MFFLQNSTGSFSESLEDQILKSNEMIFKDCEEMISVLLEKFSLHIAFEKCVESYDHFESENDFENRNFEDVYRIIRKEELTEKKKIFDCAFPTVTNIQI